MTRSAGAFDLSALHQFDTRLGVSVCGGLRLGIAVKQPDRQPGRDELDPPGMLSNRSNYTAEQANPDPTATFGIVPI